MKITPRVAVTLTFIAFGAVMGSQTGAIPVLKQQTGADAFVFGILASCGTLANIVAMSLGGVIAKRFDNRNVLLFILPVDFAALVYALMVNSIFSFGLSFAFINFTIGCTDLFMNAEAGVVEHEAKKPIFASFHGAVLLAMGFFGLVSGFIAVTYGPLWAALAALPFVVAAVYAVNKAIPHRPVHIANTNASNVVLPRKILILIGVIIGMDVAAELTCIQWSGQLLAQLQPSLAAYSGLGIAFYGLFNGGIRSVGDNLRHYFTDLTLVAASLVVSLIGFIVLALNPGFVISIIAFAITGMGLGLIFPCLFSVAAKLAPEARPAALGLVSFVSGPARICFPFLLGAIAQVYGLSMIYLAAGLGVTVALFFTQWVAREIAAKKQKEAQVTLRPSTQSLN